MYFRKYIRFPEQHSSRILLDGRHSIEFDSDFRSNKIVLCVREKSKTQTNIQDKPYCKTVNGSIGIFRTKSNI